MYTSNLNVGVKLVFRTGREDSQILSKDLTGSGREVDLTQLETGEAILSTRHEGPVHIEINAPLIKDVGSMSPEAKQFVEAIKSRNPEWIDPKSKRVSGSPRVEDGSRRPSLYSGPIGDLGDWL